MHLLVETLQLRLQKELATTASSAASNGFPIPEDVGDSRSKVTFAKQGSGVYEMN